MAKTARRVHVAIFGFEGCSAWITAGLLELFEIANNAIATLPADRTRRARFECNVVARARTVRASHGVTFRASARQRHYEVLIVPPLWCTSRADLERRAEKLRSSTALLLQLSKRSDIVASACSGAVLLARAGLLTRRRATTCWWLVDWFRQQFPEVELAADRLVMKDGDRWTAAAGSAYVHLALDLVRELADEPLAAATARLMLVERRRGSQSPFLPHRPLDTATELADDVARAVRYFDRHAHEAISIADACRALATSPRTLTRRFQTTFGTSPLTYLQSRRIARAKQLLASTSLPFERIPERCGYVDVSSFRKLFARHVGMTPREYRSRFAAATEPPRKLFGRPSR